MYEEKDAYIAAYFLLFLLAGDCVVDRASGDADDDGFRDARERSREEVESRESTPIQDTGLGQGLGLKLRLTN